MGLLCVHLIWTIPALISFWILFITIGFLVCSWAAFGFSWKSVNTYKGPKTHASNSRIMHKHRTKTGKIWTYLSHYRICENILDFWVLHCLGLKMKFMSDQFKKHKADSQHDSKTRFTCLSFNSSGVKSPRLALLTCSTHLQSKFSASVKWNLFPNPAFK